MNPEIIVFLTVLVALVKGLCQDKIKICESRNPTRPVCGTNGITYATRCQLLQAMCSDQPGLAVAHRGPCVDKHPCWANAGAKSEGGLAFRPKCLSDGSYAPVQCHEGTGYCWCVTAHGKHISDTSVRNAKPKCNRRGKLKRGSRRGNKSKKTCGRLERANFINNLIRIFKMEFGRTHDGNLNVTEDERDRMAVEWKFATMDNDTNHTLTLDEYKDLRKLVRKVVRPKKCARSFTRYCDTNKDNALSADEWKNCLKKQSIKKIKMKKKEDTDTTVIQESVPLLSGNLSDLGVEEQSERRDEPEVNDCWSDRESVLEEQQGGMTKLYVPECAQDGRYKKIQCYTSTGYCWCVHEDSGKPIPGTSTREPNPKCDAVQPPPRPMKGCSENLRKTFLADIYDFLLHYKESQTGQKPETSVDEMNIRVKKEQLAQWYFYQLDTNKNKVLERKEWKNFRTAIMPHKRLRRCGKKLPRYCDVNHDRKISITEWYNCLGAQEDNLKTSVVPSQKRKGPNPLESILLDD